MEDTYYCHGIQKQKRHKKKSKEGICTLQHQTLNDVLSNMPYFIIASQLQCPLDSIIFQAHEAFNAYFKYKLYYGERVRKIETERLYG